MIMNEGGNRLSHKVLQINSVTILQISQVKSRHFKNFINLTPFKHVSLNTVSLKSGDETGLDLPVGAQRSRRLLHHIFSISRLKIQKQHCLVVLQTVWFKLGLLSVTVAFYQFHRAQRPHASYE